MPYILERDEVDEAMQPLIDFINDNTVTHGDLNYMFTRLLLAMRPSRYHDYNALIGVLECCKLEFYRRAVAPYEDIKIEASGDVY